MLRVGTSGVFVLLTLGVLLFTAPAGAATFTYTTIDVPGAQWTQATGINNAGEIVGTYKDAAGAVHGFSLLAGAFTTIDVSGATETDASGINNLGQIVGGYTDTGGTQHGFLLSGGVFTTIDFSGAGGPGAPPGTDLSGINDSDAIVGNHCPCSAGIPNGFMFFGGSFSSTSFTAAIATDARSINNDGRIVGTYELGDGSLHGYVDAGGSYGSFDFPGASSTEGYGINLPGDVVGRYNFAHGYLDSAGTFTSLDPPGSTGTTARGINDGGQIVGAFQDSSGTHGFLASIVAPPPPNVVTNTNDSGPGSLRAAIDFANTDPGPDTISFAIPGTDCPNGVCTIKPMTPLPPITDGGTTIDGSTETAAGVTNPSGPEIQINGALAGPADGLEIDSSGNTISSLVINGFQSCSPGCGRGNGITLNGANNVVRGSYLGVDPAGTNAVPNQSAGIGIAPNGGTGNRIGGTTGAERNVISGNSFYGVLVLVGDDNTVIEGNYIGTNAAGTAAIGNGLTPGQAGQAGIHLQSNNNTISNNVISGNATGIGIFNTFSTGNSIQGNLIGTDATGSSPIGNVQAGISIGSSGNTIGGTARNVISGNGDAGIFLSGPANTVQGNYVGTDAAGNSAIPNAHQGIGIFNFGNSSNGNVVTGNVVSGNHDAGITVSNFLDQFHQISGTVIQGNRVGTNAAGTAALPNDEGVTLLGATNTLVGGTTAGARNVISGNSNHGLRIGPDPGSANNTVEGNFVGTDAAGSSAVPNGDTGVLVNGTGNTIGGAVAGARNVISGNGRLGVSLLSDNNAVTDNYIGTNADGTGAISNGNGGPGAGGLSVQANNNAVTGNVISGNDANGVSIAPLPSGTAAGNVLQGNLIGTNAAGTSAVANVGPGIFATGATNTTIGGTSSSARNVISGNAQSGVALFNGTTGTVVQGNYIGTDITGHNALPNGGNGVPVANSSQNTIGGSAPGAGNLIAFNARRGVVVFSGVSNTISRNSIFSNGALGIDLGGDGVTPNDRGDADTGPNNLQNFPVLATAVIKNGQLIVAGSIDTPSPTTVTIELFANAVPTPGGDPSGFGEGAVFLGTATPNSGGKFAAVLPAVSPGTLISATATDSGGNTSEFAANIAAR